jgi:8-oxo-dGTP pyrophosphatase MutT (NUDIX family)
VAETHLRCDFCEPSQGRASATLFAGLRATPESPLPFVCSGCVAAMAGTTFGVLRARLDDAEEGHAAAHGELLALRREAAQAVAVLVPRFGLFVAILSAKHAGAIELPGGKVEPGESTFEAARREAYEEVGVPVAIGAQLGTFLHVFDGRLWCCTAYVGDLCGAHPRGSHEGDATWATREELLAGTYGPVVRRILEAFDAHQNGNGRVL